MKPSAEYVREILSYNPETGIFTWLKTMSNRASAGSRAAGKNPLTYYGIGIRRKHYYVHQLAVVWMTGYWPSGHVDHINGDKLDNRWENLRVVSPADNIQNVKGPSKKSTTGLLGAYRAGDRFQSQIRAYNRRYSLGTFDTAEEAHAAYMAKRRELQGGNLL